MEEKRFTLDEAHLTFAKKAHGLVWDLLEKPDRSKADDEMMVHAAHASCYHWLQVGTGLNHQRGEWMISRVYAVLGNGEAALLHSKRCFELTHQHRDLMEDFDAPFAYECIARANALSGNREDALLYLRLAEQAGEQIKDDEDRKVFFESLRGGDWHGAQ